MKSISSITKKDILFLILVVLVFIFTTYSALADPLGSNIVLGPSTRKPVPNATNMTAEGGNITYITADLSQISNVWQGFFGTVTGGILLEDSTGNRFYDWNVVDAVGQIIATREFVSDWSIVNCTNQTEIYLEEERLSIQNESSDGINDTFTYTNHPTFDLAGRFISGCRSTRTYNGTDSQSVFWNVLLNTNSTNTIYTVLMENDVSGYNGTLVDFQLLVPVDRITGHSTYVIYVTLN